MRLAETLTRDWLSTNESREMVMPKNLISVQHQLTNHNINWDSAQCLTYSTNYFQRLSRESWYTNLEQTPVNRCQQLPAPYKRLWKQNRQVSFVFLPFQGQSFVGFHSIFHFSICLWTSWTSSSVNRCLLCSLQHLNCTLLSSRLLSGSVISDRWAINFAR